MYRWSVKEELNGDSISTENTMYFTFLNSAYKSLFQANLESFFVTSLINLVDPAMALSVGRLKQSSNGDNPIGETMYLYLPNGKMKVVRSCS